MRSAVESWDQREVLTQILQCTAVQMLIQLLVHAGGVGLAVFGSYARYTGVANCLFILLAFFVGQGAYLGSEYWLITWAYRFTRTLSKCRIVMISSFGEIMLMHARADHVVLCGLPSLCTEDVRRMMLWLGPATYCGGPLLRPEALTEPMPLREAVLAQQYPTLMQTQVLQYARMPDQ